MPLLEGFRLSQRNPIKLFVAHAWEDSDDYFRVFEYLESDSNFYYQNFSTPDKPPAAGDRETQREDMRRQIAPAEAVIVPCGLYRQHSEMVLFQMNFAKSANKPVIVMRAYGVKEPIPKAIGDLADETVDWDKRSLIDAIKRQARHEDTTRFDTVEFKLEDFEEFKLNQDKT